MLNQPDTVYLLNSIYTPAFQQSVHNPHDRSVWNKIYHINIAIEKRSAWVQSTINFYPTERSDAEPK